MVGLGLLLRNDQKHRFFPPPPPSVQFLPLPPLFKLDVSTPSTFPFPFLSALGLFFRPSLLTERFFWVLHPITYVRSCGRVTTAAGARKLANKKVPPPFPFLPPPLRFQGFLPTRLVLTFYAKAVREITLRTFLLFSLPNTTPKNTITQQIKAFLQRNGGGGGDTARYSECPLAFLFLFSIVRWRRRY